jgi:hypothetical protein
MAQRPSPHDEPRETAAKPAWGKDVPAEVLRRAFGSGPVVAMRKLARSRK